MEIKEILEKYIKGEYNTLKQAAEENNITIDKIKYYIKSLKKSNNLEDINMYKKYLDASRESQKRGRKKGGKNGKRKATLSEEILSELYSCIVEQDYTLRQLEQKFKIPSSTIYDNLMASLTGKQKRQIQEVFDIHRRNAANDYQNDTENSSEFHRVGTEISKPVTRKKI